MTLEFIPFNSIKDYRSPQYPRFLPLFAVLSIPSRIIRREINKVSRNNAQDSLSIPSRIIAATEVLQKAYNLSPFNSIKDYPLASLVDQYAGAIAFNSIKDYRDTRVCDHSKPL